MMRTFVAVALLAGLLACGTTSVLLVPGDAAKEAGGQVKASRVDDRTRLEIDARKLPMPATLVPSATAYVVWVRGLRAEDEASNLGTLRPDRDGNAELEAFTDLMKFSLFVTPEVSPAAPRPTGEAVVSTQFSLK